MALRGGLIVTAGVIVALLAVVAAGSVFFSACDAGQDTDAQADTSSTVSSIVELTTTTTVPETPSIQTIGFSVQGRPIELYTFGSGSWRVLIIGGVHGHECGGPVAREFLAYLEEHPEAVPTGTFLQVVPSANPDGEAATTRGNANLVDLNRNLPTANWKSRLSVSDGPTRGLTGGSAPGSEPETAALLPVLAEDWDVVISLHSYGGFVDPSGEGAMEIAERMSAAWGLPIDELYYQAHITGSLGTFMPERYGVPVITLELKSSELTDRLREALLVALTPVLTVEESQ